LQSKLQVKRRLLHVNRRPFGPFIWSTIKMQKHRSWQGASETEWQEACRRESAIRSLIESVPVSHARADVVAKDLGISRALVYRLASRYRIRAQTSSLLPSRRGRAPRSRLLNPEVEALICTVVERCRRLVSNPAGFESIFTGGQVDGFASVVSNPPAFESNAVITERIA